ncbi:unnamed protein product [Parnassius apollo]|uniref:(apollo) hypothetical protein n=1 Tax=Parnassius apollo TaxID=110799 RepID=A0A8S3WCG8_PARAO|nr:unnamed protein product [Parnassius apollo]CAG4952476.1 unnamed protein product [Parnassius apollo]
MVPQCIFSQMLLSSLSVLKLGSLLCGKLESASDYEYYQKKLICDIHFTPEDRVRNNRLKAYAIPSLYLHETLATVSDIGSCQTSTSHASNTGPSASFMLEQEPPLIVAHSALNRTLTPAVTGTVRGIAPAVIMEHNYSAASSSTRNTFAKGSVRTLTYNYVQIKPLATKIRYLQSDISRLKKRGQSFKARLANAAKLAKETAFQQVVKNMRKPAQLFVHMQMQCLKKSKGIYS